MGRNRAVSYAALALIAVGSYLAIDAAAGQPGPVATLAKAEGWRAELEPHLSPFAVIEVAYDRETAEQAWADNVPEGLPERTGDPREPGLYGRLDQVDLDEQVVVVWSSGESSSCPGWLGNIEVDDRGRVTVVREDDAGRFGACTDDYNPYRMLLAVDRDRVPGPDELPTEHVDGVPGAGAVVTTYPAD